MSRAAPATSATLPALFSKITSPHWGRCGLYSSDS
jgi:hypothetical protein